MPLLPGASVKTKVDFTRSRFEWKRQYQVDPTANLTEEGQILTRVPDVSGLDEVVVLADASASLRPAGVSLQTRISAFTFTDVIAITVPSVAPYTVQLKRGNLVDVGAGVAEALFKNASFSTDSTGTGGRTLVAGTPTPGAGEIALDVTTGLATFNVADAGTSWTLIYRYNLTAIERDELLRQSHVNRGAEDQFGLIMVATGHCWVHTTMYDADREYTVGDQLTTGDGGIFTKGGAGTDFGVVSRVPTPGDPYLGVEYLTPA